MIKIASILLIIIGVLSILNIFFVIDLVQNGFLIIEITYGTIFLTSGIISFKKPFIGLLIGTLLYSFSTVMKLISNILSSLELSKFPDGTMIIISIWVPMMIRLATLLMLILGTVKAYNLKQALAFENSQEQKNLGFH